jgi:hypothetical protein
MMDRRCSGDTDVDNLTKYIKTREIMHADEDWVKPAHKSFQLRHVTMVMKLLVS